jgi:SAM-dependent methyltransferase
MRIYNFGCGQNKISGAVNVDIEPSVKPDQIMDFTKPLPVETATADRVYFFHVIEHLPASCHEKILREFCRILKPEGIFIISYPEFAVCARNWLDNYHGQRDFWQATIYGRQLYPSDFHVALMHTPDFVETLKIVGFSPYEVKREPDEFWNTVIKCSKALSPMPTYEDVLKKEIFGQ